MKNIKELINESIMDGEEVVMKDLDDLIRVKKFYTRLRTKTPKELDMVGNPLQVGDLVIAPNKGKPMPGVIMKIRNGNFAICFTGDPNDIPRDGLHEFRTSVHGYEIIKINKDILDQINKI